MNGTNTCKTKFCFCEVDFLAHGSLNKTHVKLCARTDPNNVFTRVKNVQQFLFVFGTELPSTGS